MAMTEPTTTPVAPPPEAPKKASRTRIILMLTFGGFVLATGGCALFLTNLNFGGGGGSSERDTLSAIGAILFIAGTLGFAIGVIWAIARWIDRRFDKSKAQR
jgi:hypothetical protein